MDTVECSEFVKRQTPESGFSHFSGTWDELALIVKDCMKNPNNIKQGYKEGVILVRVPAAGIYTKYFKFFSAIVDLKPNCKVEAVYAPRMPGEDPYIRIGTKAEKQVAKHVEIVLYSAAVLEEDNDRSTNADWEIICIKARTSDEEEPMHYYTMARNHLHMHGGTQGNFSADDFAKSIIYWNSHVMCTPKISWIKKLRNFCATIFQ